MIDISTEQYNEIIKDGEKKIIIFSAPWCAPCRMFKPQLDKLATELNIPFYAINTDESGDLAEKLNIRSVPSTYVFGSTETNFVGMKPLEEVKALLA